MLAREEALARVRAQALATPAPAPGSGGPAQARANAALWTSYHPIQIAKLADLRGDLTRIAQNLTTWPDSNLLGTTCGAGGPRP